MVSQTTQHLWVSSSRTMSYNSSLIITNQELIYLLSLTQDKGYIHVGVQRSKKMSLCLISWALHHEDAWGVNCIGPLFFWPRHQLEVSGQLHVPAALPKKNEHLVPTGSQSRSGWYGAVKIFDPKGTPTLTPRSSSQWPVCIKKWAGLYKNNEVKCRNYDITL
jgi:hypothetical protein